MRLLILTQFFPPEMGAPQARLSELGERLIDRGWQVEALTALPNYPAGKVFDGYATRHSCVEQIGRIRTVRVPLYASKSGFVTRLISYLSFVVSAAWHGPGKCARPDLLYVESPPLFIGFAARYLAWRWGCPYVFNVSDLWPESVLRMGLMKPGIAARLLEWLEKSLYQHAAGCTGQSTEIVAGVRARAPQTPAAEITNGVAPARFGKQFADDAARDLLGREPGPIFTFAGLMGYAQGLDQWLDLAKTLPADVPGRMMLIGEGPVRERLQTRIESEGITRVRLAPSQPRDRIPALLAASDVAIISLGMTMPGAVPSKIYEAMASELPILLVADGEPVRRVQEATCGLSASPGDLAAIGQAFMQLATDASLRERLGSAGRAAAIERYDRDKIAARLDEFLRGLVAS